MRFRSLEKMELDSASLSSRRQWYLQALMALVSMGDDAEEDLDNCAVGALRAGATVSDIEGLLHQASVFYGMHRPILLYRADCGVTHEIPNAQDSYSAGNTL